MPDMYEKLGKLLNNVLENGKIDDTQKNKKWDQKTENLTEKSESDPILFNQTKTNHSKKKIKIDYLSNSINKNGEIDKNNTSKPFIFPKLHKYTKNMHIPKEVSDSLDTLHIVSFNKFDDIKSQYHKLLKIYHPDTGYKEKEIKNNNKNTIKDIIKAYKIVEKYYNNNN